MRKSFLLIGCVLSCVVVPEIRLGAAEAPQTYLTDNFADQKLQWGKSNDPALLAVAIADGPAQGEKALKLHFKIDRKGLGWPQSQRYLMKQAFIPDGAILAEFDMKVERLKGDIKLSLIGVPNKAFKSSRIGFIDDGKWQKVQVRITPTMPGTKLERLAFVVDQRQPEVGDENIFYIANLKLTGLRE